MLKKVGRFFYLAYALIIFMMLLSVALVNIIIKQKDKTQVFKWCAWCSLNWYKWIGISLENIFVVEKNSISINKPCIYICNHASYLDIPTMLSSVNHPIYFIAKAELGKKFILGFLTKQISLLVKREDMKERTKTFLKLKNHLEEGKSICIFPEGKINESPQVLLPFQRGSFAIALQIKIPIQPIVLLDTDKRMHVSSLFSLTKGKNRVVYLPMVDTSKYQENELEKLVEDIHHQMENTLIQYKNKL